MPERHSSSTDRARIRDLGYSPGKFKTGPKNSILDVQGSVSPDSLLAGACLLTDSETGVQVGQVTVHEDPDIHTGLTVLLPRGIAETRLIPCYAATHNLNGMGELTGTHALTEWGYINCPIALTNTVSVGKVYDGLFKWQLEQARKSGYDQLEYLRRSCIPVVGETFDGLLNDISASVIDADSVYEAVEASKSQTEVLEGNHGGGTGMRCHGFKGGTGTSSRVIPGAGKDYTLGVLVQANHGQKPDLRIGNVPIGEFLVRDEASGQTRETETTQPLPVGGKAGEGSIIVVIITDAPLLPHQLRRIAQHAGMGITQVGGHSAGRNFSGEIFLALSTGTSPDQLATSSNGFEYLPPLETQTVETVKNETIDSLFYAVSEATEEAILNAICMAEPLTGYMGRKQEALPVERVKALLEQYMVKFDDGHKL